MRVSCEVPREHCTQQLIDDIRLLGIEPIITPSIMRVVYEGTSMQLGEAIVERFKTVPCHGIVADYDKHDKEVLERRERKERQKRRKGR